MVDDSKLPNIILQIVNMLPAIALSVGILFVVIMFMLIMGGSFNEQAQLGNLPVDNQTITALESTQAQLISTSEIVGDQATTVVNYLPLVVIMLIAVGFLGFFGFTKFQAMKKDS